MEKLKKLKKTTLGVIIAAVAVLLVMIIVVCVNWFGILRKYYNIPDDRKIDRPNAAAAQMLSQEDQAYLASNENYAVGTNQYGDLVFLHPRKAYTDNKKENKDGRKALRDVYSLKHFSKTWYKGYMDKADDLQVGMTNPKNSKKITQDEVTQAHRFGLILTIYSHSFRAVR